MIFSSGSTRGPDHRFSEALVITVAFIRFRFQEKHESQAAAYPSLDSVLTDV